MTPGLRGPRVMVYMAGDFGRMLKIIGFVVFAFMTGGRFLAAEPLPIFVAIPAGGLALVAILMSIAASANRIGFVAANEFTDADFFKRQTFSMHAAETLVAAIWVFWLVVSFGQFDWPIIGLAGATLLFALGRNWKLRKMSQPRNVWEK